MQISDFFLSLVPNSCCMGVTISNGFKVCVLITINVIYEINARIPFRLVPNAF